MAESKAAVLAALVVNLLIAIIKLVAGLLAKSATMLAEAAHSFSDVGNQALLLVGISRAHRPPSPDHPFGTAKAAYFWPFMVAILLFGIAGAYSLFEGIEKLLDPHEVGDIWLSLGVLLAAFLLEIGSFLVAMRQAVRNARAAGQTTLRAFLDENRDATLLTVLVEDSLAMLGLPIAAIAITLAKVTGNPMWDAGGSIVIGLLLMGFAVFLGREVQRLLIGRGLRKADYATLTRLVQEEGDIQRIVSFQSMYLGPDAILLGAELQMRPGLAAGAVTATLRRLEERMRAAVPHLRFVYLEPQDVA